MSLPSTAKLVELLLLDIAVYETDSEASRTPRYADAWERMGMFARILVPAWSRAKVLPPGSLQPAIEVAIIQFARSEAAWEALILDKARDGELTHKSPEWCAYAEAKDRVAKLALERQAADITAAGRKVVARAAAWDRRAAK